MTGNRSTLPRGLTKPRLSPCCATSLSNPAANGFPFPNQPTPRQIPIRMTGASTHALLRTTSLKTPFEPVLRDKPIESGGKRIPFPEPANASPNSYQDDWRIYARSASDDKSPIIAMMAAIDALRAKNIPLAVNLTFILEGEEEAGST